MLMQIDAVICKEILKEYISVLSWCKSCVYDDSEV